MIATTRIDAGPDEVFAVLTDPAAHSAIDGTGWVGAIDPAPLDHSGQVFRMAMYHDIHPDKDYRMANLVEVVDPSRTIAWKPGQESETGELGFGGWTWRYDLEPERASATRLTLTYDRSAVPDPVRDEIRFPPFGQDHLDNSLRHLSELVTAR